MLPVAYMALYIFFIRTHSDSKFEGWLFYTFTLIHALCVIFIILTFLDAAITQRDQVVELTLYVFAVYQGAPVLLSLMVSPRSGVQMVKVGAGGLLNRRPLAHGMCSTLSPSCSSYQRKP